MVISLTETAFVVAVTCCSKYKGTRGLFVPKSI